MWATEMQCVCAEGCYSKINWKMYTTMSGVNHDKELISTHKMKLLKMNCSRPKFFYKGIIHSDDDIGIVLLNTHSWHLKIFIKSRANTYYIVQWVCCVKKSNLVISKNPNHLYKHAPNVNVTYLWGLRDFLFLSFFSWNVQLICTHNLLLVFSYQIFWICFSLARTKYQN